MNYVPNQNGKVPIPVNLSHKLESFTIDPLGLRYHIQFIKLPVQFSKCPGHLARFNDPIC